MSITIGQQAPDFSLYSSDKTKINLSDYAGKNLVVLFFPLAFTGICTAELCTMRDSLANFNNLNAEIIGISIDSLFVLDKFNGLVFADGLITSGSSFSYIAAIFNRGIVYYKRFWHKPANHWVIGDNIPQTA